MIRPVLPIGNIPMGESEVRPIGPIPSVANYLRQLASQCWEVADRRELLPLFLRVPQLVPRSWPN